jgi:DNA-binding IclR family transcriptional regulator
MTDEHGMGIYLYRSNGSQAIDLDTHTGLRAHLHSTALGKAILAHRPAERVDEIVDQHGLPPVNENTVTDREELLDQLERIRERGFALDDEERLQGLRCVAAPIKPADGKVIGSISVSAPTSRMGDDRFHEEIPDVVRSAANVMELRIRYA